jgi:hypothetical protein
MNQPTDAVRDDAGATPNIKLEFLYLDLSVCGRCQGTGRSLEQALRAARDALAAMGIGVDVDSVHVANADIAKAVGLVVSPTIRIDGRDIQPDVLQSPCADCGDLCGCDGGCTNCRKWRWRDREYTAAPPGLIVEALMAAAVARNAPFRGSQTVEPFATPAQQTGLRSSAQEQG